MKHFLVASIEGHSGNRGAHPTSSRLPSVLKDFQHCLLQLSCLPVARSVCRWCLDNTKDVALREARASI